jgi:hypothetical protein
VARGARAEPAAASADEAVFAMDATARTAAGRRSGVLLSGATGSVRGRNSFIAHHR